MKILVVDDETIVLDSCRLVLGEEGFDVLTVSSADEALKAIEYDKPSLLLIDVKMPGRNGMYLMREVRKNYPHIPVIVMSGYATKDTIAEAVEIGAASFIAKPFTPEELLKKIRNVIQKEEDHGKEEGLGD